MRKTYIKNLLSINKKAFQFLHDVEGFDFEKPYFITEQPGKFTANTVKKAIAEHLNPAACKISVFVIPTASRCLRDLYFVTLRLDNFSASRRDDVSYWNYRAAAPGLNIDYCFGVGDFEKLRKSETEKIYIIAQEKEYTTIPPKKNIDFSARYTLKDSRINGDGRGGQYMARLDLVAMDGSRAEFKHEPYNTFYGNEKRSAELADFIDKSGFLLRPHRLELMEKAERLRNARKQAEADSADYTNEIAELQKRIDATRILLSNAVLNCQDATAARGVSNRMNYFSYALSYFETFKEKINNKRYASIERINSDIEDIKDKLDHCAE